MDEPDGADGDGALSESCAEQSDIAGPGEDCEEERVGGHSWGEAAVVADECALLPEVLGEIPVEDFVVEFEGWSDQYPAVEDPSEAKQACEQ